MKITFGIFGFGKSGSVVAHEILDDDLCELKWVIRKSHKNEGEYASRILGFDYDKGMIYSIDSIKKNSFFKENYVDIIVDFSSSSALETYDIAADYGTRIVTAISKYDRSQLMEVHKLSKKTAVLYSPNITLGINFLIEASKMLQKILPSADIEIIEEHFKEKPDVSGTAIRIAEDLGLDKDRHVNSIRVGGIVGKHEVVFGLPNQTIRIIHESLNRNAFGQGAVFAAKWLADKEKGIYSMEEVVKLSFPRNSNIVESDL